MTKQDPRKAQRNPIIPSPQARINSTTPVHPTPTKPNPNPKKTPSALYHPGLTDLPIGLIFGKLILRLERLTSEHVDG